MRDMRKWYMRLVLILASYSSCMQLFVGYFSNIFFNAKGFIFKPPEFFLWAFSHIDKMASWGVYGIYGIFLLFIFIGPLLWPRIFIWPAVISNLFILSGNIDLLWNNYEISIISSHPKAAYGEYTWIIIQVFFIFFSGLFVALLLPAAVHLVKLSGWYQRGIHNA